MFSKLQWNLFWGYVCLFLQIRVHAARRSVWFHSFSPRSYAECSQADSSDHFTSLSPVWNLTLLPGGCDPGVFRAVLHAAVSCNPVFISVRVLSKEATVLLQAGQLTLQCRRTKVVHASNVCMNPHYYMLWYLHSVVVYKFPSQAKDPWFGAVSGGTLVKKCQIQHLVVPKSPFEYRAAENSFHLYTGKFSLVCIWVIVVFIFQF